MPAADTPPPPGPPHSAQAAGELVLLPYSRIEYRGVPLLLGRTRDRDVIVAPAFRQAPNSMEAGHPPLPLSGGEPSGEATIFPAHYDNMISWEVHLAPERRLQPLNRAGFGYGFGAGNRMVISWNDLPHLRARATLGGWDGIFAAMLQSSAPFWFIQQSIVRELIPEGLEPAHYPGIGHTGGYGPREFLRAGLFAFAGLGGYTRYGLPIGADADHAIVTGHDEESLQRSLAMNRLALSEARDFTKFTVDTSHLFGFPAEIGPQDRERLLKVFRGRHFRIPNVLPGGQEREYEFDQDEVLRLGRLYWRACAVHKELYDHVASERSGRPFDYELSLDETPLATPPRELLFYLVLLYDVMGLEQGGVASAGPNLGYNKREDFRGDLDWLQEQANACASILAHFGAMLAVHSADGERAATGKGVGFDVTLLAATGGRAELKVADVYQEVLWHTLESSPEPAERELFREAWRRTYAAVALLAEVYRRELAPLPPDKAQRVLMDPMWQGRVARNYGAEALRVTHGVIHYGLPLFRLASDLVGRADPDWPSAEAELFRRFMFLTYRGLRPDILRLLTAEGWARVSRAIHEATMVRIRAMGWELEA
ncbi:MAG: hypothetical protein HPY83_17180 [Anaerolineae bacterium]|nr:hypothetical protein [Anaerolineae bacterium]